MIPEQTPTPAPMQATYSGLGMANDDPNETYRMGVTFRYDAREPYCLSLEIWAIGEPDSVHPWTVARETVHVACVWGTDIATAGADFSATVTEPGCIRLRFHHSDPCGRHRGHLDVQVDRAEVYAFLERTVAAVPPGTESRYLDIDTALAQLLAH